MPSSKPRKTSAGQSAIIIDRSITIDSLLEARLTGLRHAHGSALLVILRYGTGQDLRDLRELYEMAVYLTIYTNQWRHDLEAAE